MRLHAFKGSLAYELQVGWLVMQWCHSGQRYRDKRLVVWRDHL